MSLSLIWSPAAKDEYANLLEYIEKGYGLESVLKFMDKTEAALDQIASFPDSGVSTTKEIIRKKVITKQTSVLYQIFEDSIELLHFWDNRQNPGNLKELLE